MAKVKLSIFATKLSGKAGNVVFNNTKEGTVMRERTTGANPQTAAQVAVRTALTRASRQWATLTTAQVAAWEAYGKRDRETQTVTGKSFNQEGFNAFVELAAKYYLVNPGPGTAPVNPPTASFFADSVGISVASQAGALVFTATAANSANVKTALMVQPLASKNRQAMKDGFRTKSYVAFAAGALTASVTVPAGYYACGYQFVNTLTGQVSGIYYINSASPVTVSLADSVPAKSKKAA